MLEGVLGRLTPPDPSVRIALDRGVGLEPVGHVIALVRVRVRRGGLALMVRMVGAGRP